MSPVYANVVSCQRDALTIIDLILYLAVYSTYILLIVCVLALLASLINHTVKRKPRRQVLNYWGKRVLILVVANFLVMPAIYFVYDKLFPLNCALF